MGKAKKLTKIYLAVVGALLLVAGLACVFNPSGALDSAAWFIGLCIMVAGVATIIFYFIGNIVFPFNGAALIEGIFEVVISLIFLRHPESVSTIIVILIGLMLAGMGLVVLIAAAVLKKTLLKDSGWGWAAIAVGLIITALGFVCIFNTSAGGAIIAIPIGLVIALVGSAYIVFDVFLIKAGKSGEDEKYFTDVD